MEELSGIRQLILNVLKKEQSRTIAELASAVGVTYESVRQQLLLMEREGWVAGSVNRSGRRGAGRPIAHYSLTTAGEHLFPKHYDQLAIRLIDTIGEELGEELLLRLLANVTDAQVLKWEPLLRGKDLEERIEILKDLYQHGDSHMEIVSSGEGLMLIERNCPYLNVAMRHSALCSTSVSALTRLLGVRVVRTERFQNGDRRCVFRVMEDQPVDTVSFRFQIELPVVQGSPATP
ncbi:MAG TPA: winged helix-turn-helix transcriptional regulator [Candidatus Kapabacteria bacterium]|nr:winged helix-turn-helix transcriptional regulator [Candidatus Kapabacteria bacterium]